MHFLFICDEYPPGKSGGIGTAVQLLARELVRTGHAVSVVGLYAHSYGQADFETDEGVKVWRLRYGLNLGNGKRLYSAFNKLPGFMRALLNGRSAYARFLNFVKTLVMQTNIDLIEVADWNTFAMHIGFVPQWPVFGAPLVLKLHGSYTYLRAEMGQPAQAHFRQMDMALFNRAEAIVAVSRHSAKQTQRCYGTDKPVQVLYNAIRVPPVNTGVLRHEHEVVFTGSLVPIKGIAELVQQWPLVKKQVPGAKLIIYGKGKEEPLRQLLPAGLAESVEFKGHVPRDRIFEALSRATLAVFPSYSETFGYGAVEAMALGCPVIYTKRASGPEVVSDGESGLLVDPAQPGEIATAIVTLLSNRALRKKISERARQVVLERFNIEVSVKQHLEFYQQVIAGFKKDKNS